MVIACSGALVGALVLGACGGGDRRGRQVQHTHAREPTTTTSEGSASSTPAPAATTVAPTHRDYPRGTFAAADAALARRVAAAGLSGGFVRIVADDGTVLHEPPSARSTARRSSTSRPRPSGSPPRRS